MISKHLNKKKTILPHNLEFWNSTRILRIAIHILKELAYI